MNSRSFIYSAIISGIVIGLLANLPALNLINCFLCIFVWIGGILSIFIYRGFQHGEFNLTAKQGAGLGALSGLIGAFVGIFVNALTNFISMPMFISLADYLKIDLNVPPQTGSLASIITSTFFFFVLDAIFYPLFGAISGYITASLMKSGKQT